ncbi:MAG: ATP-binding protein [Solirubrobacteraceae bacterium]
MHNKKTGVRSAGMARGIREGSTTLPGGLWLLSVLAITATVVVLAAIVPASDYNSPTLRATAETVMTLFAFGGAWLLRAQFGFSRRLRDLLLLGALLTLGLMTLFSRALPAALNLDAGGQFSVVGLWGELFVAAAFAAAAFAPADSLIAGGRPVLIVAILSVLAVALGELGGLFLGAQFGAVAAHGARGTIGAAQHPLELVVVLGTTGLFICGAVVFASRDRIDHDGLGRWLAGGAILLAATSLSHLGLPFPASQPVASREAVRLLAFALLLAAAVRLELQLRKTAAQAATIAERRRVAQDLHDGLAQDLAFIAAHGARIAERLGDEHPVAIAARRALATSRCTIAELSDPGAATAQEALESVAYELRDRFDMKIAVHARLGDEIAPDAREHVARIAREAIANAARHGRAENVVVSLKQTDQGMLLRVVDDGSGIDNTRSGPASEGFGLRSMRERAASLGGQLTVRQPRKRGTELEVMLP